MSILFQNHHTVIEYLFLIFCQLFSRKGFTNGLNHRVIMEEVGLFTVNDLVKGRA